MLQRFHAVAWLALAAGACLASGPALASDRALAAGAGALLPPLHLATPLGQQEKSLAAGSLDLEAWKFRRLQALSNWPPIEQDPPADVLHYDLDLHFVLADTTLHGTATLTVRWGSAIDGILRLDLKSMTVSEVRDGGGAPLAFAQDADGISITYDPPPAAGDTVVAAIDYGGHPAVGFYNHPGAAYTFTEPEASRYWFPCRDVPWDKATLRLHGHAPAGMTLVGNGVLDSLVTGVSEDTYHWREDHPIATYLIAAVIANYTKVSVPSPVTDLAWYAYPAHVAAANTAFQNVPDMLAFYDSTLVPYPFDKYTMCEASIGGGMEHQTATLLGTFIFTGGQTYEWVTAHELAHHWFGDLVTAGGWSHIWLNEGAATFYEAVWQGHFYGPATFAARMQAAQDLIFEAEDLGLDHPIVDPAPGSLFDRMEYQKGAWVLHMLRAVLGQPDYDAAIQDYLTTYAYGNATTEDLQAVMEAHYGSSLQWFFDEWLYGNGHPRLAYQADFTPEGNDWRVDIDATQVPSGTTLFTYPLPVKITTTTGDTVVTGWIQGGHTVLSFLVPDPPLSVTLDPDNQVLDENFDQPVAVIDGPSPARFVAWPNPFVERLNIAGGVGGAIEILDVRGRRVRSLTPAANGAAVWDGRDRSGRRVAPGIYFVRAPGAGRAARVVYLGR